MQLKRAGAFDRHSIASERQLLLTGVLTNLRRLFAKIRSMSVMAIFHQQF